MPNTHRRRDSTLELSRVGGVYTIRNYKVGGSLDESEKMPTAKSSWVVSAL